MQGAGLNASCVIACRRSVCGCAEHGGGRDSPGWLSFGPVVRFSGSGQWSTTVVLFLAGAEPQLQIGERFSKPVAVALSVRNEP